MNHNRSIPESAVIPTLAYPDVRVAAAWLCKALGFSERLRIGDHRIQLAYGDGAMVVTEMRETEREMLSNSHGTRLWHSHRVMLRVADADAHCANAERHGAMIKARPTTYPYGERQYTAVDIGGHEWTFTQTVADVNPADWGGELV